MNYEIFCSQLIFPMIIAVLGWIFNEKSKARERRKNIKEKIYEELVLAVQGFYSDNKNREIQDNFLKNMLRSYVHLSPQIISAVSSFAQANTYEDHIPKVDAFNHLVMEIRKDLSLKELTDSVNLYSPKNP
jgi:hypothetical protein